MRIISDFHDYYDCGQKLDQDKQTLYIRKMREEQHSWRFPILYNWGNYDPQFKILVIGFCGKLYPIFEIRTPYPTFGVAFTYCYTIEQIDSFIQTYYRKDAIEQYFSTRKYNHRIRIIHRTEFVNFYKEWNLHYGEYYKFYNKVFEENKCPIFVINLNNNYDTNILFNICLKEYNFVKIIDPITAYQEINMFINNLAIPSKPIPKVTDKAMAEIKGFNKYSFRKDPSRKKK